MKKILLSVFAFILFLSTTSRSANPDSYTYAVVISQSACSDAGWKAVADSLLKKHSINSSKLFTWKNSVSEVRESLAAFMPTYTGFIARPVTECNSAFVVSASQLSRTLDTDPYGDTYWGVITGFEAADAMRAISESLLVKTVILGSGGINYEPPIERYYQAIGLPCESYTKTDYMFPNTDSKVYSVEKRPDNQTDRVNILAKWLNSESLNISIDGKGTISGPFDCLITGGHGNVNLWQMHYSDAGNEGYIGSSKGQLIGDPYSGSSITINSPTPKIYWHVCNCLMATPDNINNWVYAAFHTGHAVQLFGFIPEASTGDEFMAWGMFDRTTKFAGRYTLPQAHFISNNNAQFELKHSTGLFNQAGVRAYMDSTLVYGDPAADVRFLSFGDSARVYKDNFSFTTGSDGKTTFEYNVTAVAHDIEFGQGYCYQLRPVLFMPVRIDPQTVSIVKNEGSTAEITDNLLLWEMLSKGETLKKGATKKLSWTAELLDKTAIKKIYHSEQKRMTLNCAVSGSGIIVISENIPDGKVTLSINDISGRLVLTKHSLSSGQQFKTIVNQNFAAPGRYLITLKHESGSIQTSFTHKQK